MPHDFVIVNGDTDSISFRSKDGSPFTKEERAALIAELNAIMPSYIEWEDDDYFPKFIVVKKKNYIMLNEQGKLTIKGSGLKGTMKEKALQAFLAEVIQLLLNDGKDYIYSAYMRQAKDILNLKDISAWCSKHTITKAVLTSEETTQVRIRQALKGRPYQEGDKVYQFFKTNEERCLLEHFDGTYDSKKLLGKLYDTLCIFETVIDVKAYPNLTLKRNKHILEGLK